MAFLMMCVAQLNSFHFCDLSLIPICLLEVVILGASCWYAIFIRPFDILDPLCFVLVCYLHIDSLSIWNRSGYKSIAFSSKISL